MRIEQAIYASRQTDHAAGYHLVIASEGVTDDDAHALSMWGPSHDSLVSASDDQESINFHPLPSGSYCISRTRRTGTEYSGRGEEVYTHSLVVPAELLARFSNNPLALLRAAMVDGRLEVREQIPRTLPSFVLRGKASPVDRRLLGKIVAKIGPERFSAFLEAALHHDPLAVVTPVAARNLMDGLLNCLPVVCRTSFSFATGLKPSPRRPFRMQFYPKETNDLRNVLRPTKSTVFDLEAGQELSVDGGWAHVVMTAIVKKQFGILTEELSRPIGDGDVADFGERASRLQQRLQDGSEVSDDDWRGRSRRSDREWESRPARSRSASRPTPLESTPAKVTRRGDAPHLRLVSCGESQALVEDDLHTDPAQQLGVDRPEMIEQLELLDDTVFEAIAGKPTALELLKTLWPQTLALLGMEKLEESKEQYLRHAQEVWEHCATSDGVRKSEQSLAALSVMSVLLDECPM